MEETQNLGQPRLAVATGEALDLERVFDGGADGEVGPEGVGLKDEADFAVPRGQALDESAIEIDLAVIEAVKTGD